MFKVKTGKKTYTLPPGIFAGGEQGEEKMQQMFKLLLMVSVRFEETSLAKARSVCYQMLSKETATDSNK